MLGERLKFAREAAGLRQEDAAGVLDISPSGVSYIESGRREPKAAQLAKLSDLYHRSIDFFFSDKPLHEDFVLWRCKPEEEAEAKRIQREFFELCENYHKLEELTGQIRPSIFPDATKPDDEYAYNDAESLAFEVWQEFCLGVAPAEIIRHVLEEKYNVRVFALAAEAKTSALCMRHERLGTCVLLNQNNVSWRRNYDLAHELFHLLTWSIFRTGCEGTSEIAGDDEERFANVFASRLLLPEAPFRQRLYRVVKNEQLRFIDVHELAREFDVSSEAVIYRIAGLCHWKKKKTEEIVKQIKDFYVERENHPVDKFPRRYVYLAVLAYRRGLISYGRAAKYLQLGHKKAKGILEPSEDEIDLDTTIPAVAG